MNPRRFLGAAVGLVTDLNDPEQVGRVKVRFPWVHDEETSHWCRMAATQAGKSSGDFVRPEVGDEVLVMFERGDPNQPYVMGALWNGQDAPPGPGNPDGKNDHKFFQSRSGHQWIFNDGDDGGYIEFHDFEQRLHTKFDVPGKHVHWKADSGTINIEAPEGLIRMECVDLVVHSTNDTSVEVTNAHDITVSGTRSYSAKTLTQTAGSSKSVSTPSLSLTCKVLTSATGGTSASIGSVSAKVEPKLQMECKGPVTRTVSSKATFEVDSFRTENQDGPSGPLTINGAEFKIDAGAIGGNAGGPISVTGLVKIYGDKISFAKDQMDGQGAGPASLINLMGGTVLINPQGIVGPVPKQFDTMVGADFHNQAPGAALAPFPLAPHGFVLPMLIDTKATVLVHNMPAGVVGSTALGVHIPVTYAPAFVPIPMSYRMMINAAIVATILPAMMAVGQMIFGMAQAHAAGTSPQAVLMAGANSPGEAAWRWFRGAFPMTQSFGAFISMLAGLAPYPVAAGSMSIGAPNVTAEDAPLSQGGQLFSNSCSDIPIIPNATTIGSSTVQVGITMESMLKQLAFNAAVGVAAMGAGALMNRVNPPRGGKLDTVMFDGLQQWSPTRRNQTNCGRLGEPVDPVSGTRFDKDVDVELPGPFPLKIERNYSSVDTVNGRGGLAGIGWRFNFESSLTLHYGKGIPKFWVRHDAELRTVQLPWLEELGEWAFVADEKAEFARADDKLWDFRDEDDVTWRYEEHAKDRARLVAWFDRNGNAVTVHYHRKSDVPEALTDSLGRRLKLEIDRDRLVAVRWEGQPGRWSERKLFSYRYDAQQQLSAAVAPDGATRKYAYDHRNRLVHLTEPGGFEWFFHYDAQGRATHTYGEDLSLYVDIDYQPAAQMTVATDHSGRKEFYKYDDTGRIEAKVDREGHATRYAYDDLGNKVAETDGAGNTTEWAYDDHGRVVEKVLPTGGKWQYTYDRRGYLAEETDPCGATTRFTRDGAGNPVRTRHPDGSETLRRHDEAGRVVVEVRPDGSEHRYRYDELGDLVEEEHDGEITLHAYDAFARRVKTTGPDGEETRFEYDNADRLTKRHDPDGRTVRWSYDAFGQITECIDRDGNSWITRYDKRGRLIERKTPDGWSRRTEEGIDGKIAHHLDDEGRGFRYTYDRAQRLARHEHDDGVTKRYQRDGAGHLTRVRFDDGGWREFEVDEAGRPLRKRTRDGVLQTFTRDAMGRFIEAIEVPAHGLNPRRVALRRAADGAIIDEVGPAGRVRHTYGPGRRLRRLEVDGVALKVARDGRGSVLRAQAPDGIYAFDGDVLTTPKGARITANEGGWALIDARERATAAYADTLDANARREGERLVLAGGGGWEHRFAFDRSLRLAEPYDEGSNRLVDGLSYGAGQRLKVDRHGPVKHDLRGRVVERETADGRQQLWWDDHDRLTEVENPDGTVVRYRYDALHRLVERVVDPVGGVPRCTEFLWAEDFLAGENRADGSRLRYLRLDPSDPTPWAVWVESPWGSGLHLLLRDARGAVIAACDAEGAISWLGEYSPYGECRVRDRGLDQRLRLPGMWADPLTGIHYNRFRWYVPEWGRYLTKDPLGISGGQNPYAYATCDPIHRVDPLGLACNGTDGGTTPKKSPGDVPEGEGTTPPKPTLAEATQAEADAAQGLSNRKRPGMAAGMETPDGDITTATSQRGGGDPLDGAPQTKAAYDKAGTEASGLGAPEGQSGKCGEAKLMADYERANGQMPPEGSEFHAKQVRRTGDPEHGKDRAACPFCSHVMNEKGYVSNTGTTPGGTPGLDGGGGGGAPGGGSSGGGGAGGQSGGGGGGPPD